MVTYTVEGSSKTFTTWTDAKNHAASVVARRKTDSKVAIKRNGQPYGEMWKQGGKIKYTTPCKPHTMAIPDAGTAKKKTPPKKDVPKKTPPKKDVPKKTTPKKTPPKKDVPKNGKETPNKGTNKGKTVSDTDRTTKKLPGPKETPKKSKYDERDDYTDFRPQRQVPRPEYEGSDSKLLGPGAQRRERGDRKSLPAPTLPKLSWEEGKARHEENRRRREERREKREDRKQIREQDRQDRRFRRDQKRMEREVRKSVYIDEPDDPEPDGARARDRGDDGRRRAGEGSRSLVPTKRRSYNSYDAPAEIEVPKERRIMRGRSDSKALPAPKGEITTATTEDGQTIEVEILPPKRDRRRIRCPTAAIALRGWAWRPHPFPISAG